MGSELTFDFSDIQKHLSVLFSLYDEEDYENFHYEVRCYNEERAFKIFYKDLEQVKGFLERREKDLIEQKLHVLISLFPRFSEKTDDVRFCNTWVIDIDEKIPKEEVLKRLENVEIKPFCLIMSGKGWHIYIKSEKKYEPKTWRRIAIGIFDHYSKFFNEIDYNMKDYKRCVRLAGTINWKHEKLVKIEEIFGDVSNDLEKYMVKEREVTPVELTVTPKSLDKKRARTLINAFDGFWVEGHRNNLTLWICGTMAKMGFKKEDALYVISKIVEKYGDEEWRHRLYVAKTEFDRYISKVQEFKGVSGIIEEMFSIGTKKRMKISEIVRRIEKIFRVLGIKRSEYLRQMVNYMIGHGHFDEAMVFIKTEYFDPLYLYLGLRDWVKKNVKFGDISSFKKALRVISRFRKILGDKLYIQLKARAESKLRTGI